MTKDNTINIKVSYEESKKSCLDILELNQIEITFNWTGKLSGLERYQQDQFLKEFINEKLTLKFILDHFLIISQVDNFTISDGHTENDFETLIGTFEEVNFCFEVFYYDQYNHGDSYTNWAYRNSIDIDLAKAHEYLTNKSLFDLEFQMYLNEISNDFFNRLQLMSKYYRNDSYFKMDKIKIRLLFT